jgi:hypothetical protein
LTTNNHLQELRRMPPDLVSISNPITSTTPKPPRPRFKAGRQGERRWWEIGADRVELRPVRAGWHARVHRAGWGGLPLDLDGQFANESEAVAWCQRMADVLARDADDDLDD